MPKKQTVAGTTKDPTLDFVPLELNGKTFNLLYSYNDIATAEDEINRNIMWVEAEENRKSVASGKGLVHPWPRCNLQQALENLGELNAAQLRGLTYAALLRDNPGITIEEVGDMMKLGAFLPIKLALIEAYRRSAQLDTDPTGAGIAPAENSATVNTGTASGPSPEST